MSVAADLGREASLRAIWRALYAASSCVENESEIGGVTNVAQWFDYAPYGSVIATTNTGQTVAARGYIGQFSDLSGLSYLNARYYNASQGQFITQDPVFWDIPSRQNLKNPQTLNTYSYANDNPITGKDPYGRDALGVSMGLGAEGGLGFFAGFQLSAGITYVYNPDTGQRWLVPAFTMGGTAGVLGSYECYPGADNDGLPTVIGAAAGGSLSGSYSPYVKKPGDLGGIESSMNVNAGFISASVQGAKTNSPTFTVGGGPGLGGSMSIYPVQTWTGPSYGWTGQKQSSNNKLSPVSQQGGSQSSNASGGGGGGSSAQLIGLYQSLVATLTALVSALSAPKTAH